MKTPNTASARSIFLKILKRIVILLIVYTIAMGVSLIPQRAADAPCDYLYGTYREQDACFAAWDRAPNDFGGASQIESFITTYAVSTSGGGCYHDKTATNNLNVQNDSFHLQFEKVDGRLSVNGSPLEIGVEFQTANYFQLSPWIVSRLMLKNYGDVVNCGDAAGNSRAMIIGSSGTEFSLIKGGLISLAFIASLVLINRNLKQH